MQNATLICPHCCLLFQGDQEAYIHLALPGKCDAGYMPRPIMMPLDCYTRGQSTIVLLPFGGEDLEAISGLLPLIDELTPAADVRAVEAWLVDDVMVPLFEALEWLHCWVGVRVCTSLLGYNEAVLH